MNNLGYGILHILAAEGDLEMFGVFFDAKLRGVSTVLKNVAGKTPVELFDERNSTTELYRTFEYLLKSVEKYEQGIAVEVELEDTVEDDVFFDALETQKA